MLFRKFIYLIFIISLACNVYFAYNYYQIIKNRQFIEVFLNNSKIKKISQKEGVDFLFKNINFMQPEYQKSKKYYFISIWNTMCRPCIKEMPLLDSMTDIINRKDFAYFFITENGEKMITQFREKHKISSRNFNFINDADIYISSILKSHNMETRQYPIQLIIDNKGEVKYFQVGTIDSANDSLVMNCIKNLKE
jgi:hypothetical protein